MSRELRLRDRAGSPFDDERRRAIDLLSPAEIAICLGEDRDFKLSRRSPGAAERMSRALAEMRRDGFLPEDDSIDRERVAAAELKRRSDMGSYGTRPTWKATVGHAKRHHEEVKLNRVMSATRDAVAKQSPAAAFANVQVRGAVPRSSRTVEAPINPDRRIVGAPCRD